MRKIIILFLLLSHLQLLAQDPQKLVKPIIEEGKKLYRSEMASWHGTDLFLEQYQDHNNIGGYFSYEENNNIKCIFFSNESAPKIIGTIVFDATFKHDKAIVYLEERAFNKIEKRVFDLRQAGLNAIKQDTLFKYYQNINFNIIPLVGKNESKVYVLSGPTQSGVIVFGNDYLLTFDTKNKLINSKALHKNIIPITYEENDNKIDSYHTHLPETGDLITATDVCTLMLYGKFTGWKEHKILSKEYYMSWNINSEEPHSNTS